MIYQESIGGEYSPRKGRGERARARERKSKRNYSSSRDHMVFPNYISD